MAPPDPGDAGQPVPVAARRPDEHARDQRSGPVGDDPVLRPQRGHRGRVARPTSSPSQRIQVEQLSRVAELNVIEATGMPVSPDGRRLTCVPVGRGDWTCGPSSRGDPLLPPWPRRPPAGAPRPPPGHRAAPATRSDWTTRPGAWPPCSVSGPPPSGRCSSGCRSARWSGHLSQRTLGQYPLALPWAPSDELLLVTANIAEFAEDWSLPDEEALLWVCARELATNTRAEPARGAGPVRGAAAGTGRVAAAAQQDLAGRLRGLTGEAPDADAGRAWTSSRSRGCSGTPRRCSASC